MITPGRQNRTPIVIRQFSPRLLMRTGCMVSRDYLATVWQCISFLSHTYTHTVNAVWIFNNAGKLVINVLWQSESHLFPIIIQDAFLFVFTWLPLRALLSLTVYTARLLCCCRWGQVAIGNPLYALYACTLMGKVEVVAPWISFIMTSKAYRKSFSMCIW